MAEEQQQETTQGEMEAGGVNCLAYDEAIMAQQDRIQQEIATSIPLVSDRQELSVLQREYAVEDTIYQLKIKVSKPQESCITRFESQISSLFKAVAAKSKLDLVNQGFTEFTIEDFHNTFMDLLELCEKQPGLCELLGSFRDQSVSDYIVVYLRLLTSGYLQREHGFFQHFIEGGRSVKEFCQQEVEPMSKESDHIHIIALAQALNVSILVEYMDRGEGGSVNHHVFPEGSEPRVFLLYRPGHYDILYK
uniref:ubiquitinyl hydrolase 1 n=1 Tax=Oncorhynchus mykiss TaxID=8022 RepID=A0A8C7W2C2_ONCMY